MRSKFEAWILILDSRSKIGNASDEASAEVNCESGAIANSNEVRCTKFTSTKIRGFLANEHI